MTRMKAALLVVLLPFAAGCLGAFAATTPAPPLPLDPLAEPERQLALDLALADPQARDLLDERHRVIGASLRVDKARTLQGDRLADVQVYRYVSNDVLWAVVDLGRGAVESVTLHAFQPPLTAEELAEAQDALLAHPQVREALGATAGVTIEAILMAQDEGPCAVARCIEARFLDAQGAPRNVRVLYDLSAPALVRLMDGREAGA